jgi:hypothetical protein
MGNVEDVVREKDILFRFRRINQKGNIILLGVMNMLAVYP